MYAIVKTIEEAEQLNDYIKAEYFNQVTGASFEKWTEIIPVENGYALEVMDEWVDYTIPEFLTEIVFQESLNISTEGINQ